MRFAVSYYTSFTTPPLLDLQQIAGNAQWDRSVHRQTQLFDLCGIFNTRVQHSREEDAADRQECTQQKRH
ncbi:hypothetical protein D3C87_2138560 [compost metagenome]